MARVTCEDCLEKVDNRFQLIHLAAQRVEQLRRGAVPLVHAPKNKEVVLALREIAAAKVMPGRPGEELPPVQYYQPELEAPYEAEEGEEGYEAEGEQQAAPAQEGEQETEGEPE